MTMVLCISRGRGSIMKALMLIFTNKNSNYFIYGLDDSISKVYYRTNPKG